MRRRQSNALEKKHAAFPNFRSRRMRRGGHNLKCTRRTLTRLVGVKNLWG